jgi:peroxiredoxin Q/BCP
LGGVRGACFVSTCRHPALAAPRLGGILQLSRPNDDSHIFAARIGNPDLSTPKVTKAGHMADELKPGGRAPAFKLKRDDGSTVALKDFKGRKLVLYFFPKADTPGCTREAIDFSRLRPQFAKAGTDVVGVSADPVERQDKFKRKHKIAIPLASDPTHEMLTAYGAWGEKMLYGRRFMGVIRKTFLIDEGGRILHIWPKVSVDGHAADVLATARQ